MLTKTTNFKFGSFRSPEKHDSGLIKERSYSSDSYRFGFQGQESDGELSGVGNSYAFEYRIHDSRLGRFLSIDPLIDKYPYWTPYGFSANRVIDAFEFEGLEPVTKFNKTTKTLIIVIQGRAGTPPNGKTQSQNAGGNMIPDKDALGQVKQLELIDNSIQVEIFASSPTDNTKNDIKTSIENFKKNNTNGNVVIIGHSLGAQNAIELLDENRSLKVDLLITLENVDLPYRWDDDDVYGNVANGINYYQRSSLVQGEITEYIDKTTNGVNVGPLNSCSHTTIDNMCTGNVMQDVLNFTGGLDAPSLAKQRNPDNSSSNRFVIPKHVKSVPQIGPRLPDGSF